ncbi:hypothetical protein ORI89_14710 [Sphingobacterium sp. UT-1RO-CII-1]|uniref:hypothetical protein n=1 Tax=Sphingobacterium sp. UT-1RO-CII-1 TaxID=2995225 RepID=UPI00227B0711|nr:hypothetical protein [Sphingobacterium sp. UT-1RO-CII-1]MCY4780908.1 hypothetical protein [Sphingobacterium sp. UT-1RO-CII-1]
MMTFEEFFAKKKIDLTVLLAENPSLYREFEDHYAQMGPKSFDHTKKFWFNKLRKTYLLKEISPDLGKQTTTQASKPSTPPIQQQSTVPTTFKPRFKAAAAPLQKETTEQTAKPTGFKPRFKAGLTKPAIEQQELQKETTEQVAKPTGFKPRFKAATTPVQKTAIEQQELQKETTEQAAKPTGFKPRFKAGLTKPKNNSEGTQ